MLSEQERALLVAGFAGLLKVARKYGWPEMEGDALAALELLLSAEELLSFRLAGGEEAPGRPAGCCGHAT